MVKVGELVIEIRGEIKDIKKSLETVEKDLEKTKKATEKTSDSTSGLSKQFSGLSGIVNVARGVMGAWAVTMAADVVKASARAQEALETFNLVMGDTAKTLITDLRAASRGTVSDLELMQTAMRATALGISESRLPELMEVARARAKIMGITTTQAFNDISLGIGRQSRMILDNLGIIINLDDAYKRYAATVGKTVETLTDFDRKMAITNEIVEKNEALVAVMALRSKTASDVLSQEWTKVKNVFLELGDAIGEAIVRYDEYNQRVATGMMTDPQVQAEIDETIDLILSVDKALAKATQSAESAKTAIFNFSAAKYYLTGELEGKEDILALQRQLTGAEIGMLTSERQLKATGISPTTTMKQIQQEERRGFTYTQEEKELVELYQKQKETVEDLRGQLRIKMLEQTANFTQEKEQIDIINEKNKALKFELIKTPDELKAIQKSLEDNYKFAENHMNYLTLYAKNLGVQLKELEKQKDINITVNVKYKVTGKIPWGVPVPQALQEDLNAKVG